MLLYVISLIVIGLVAVLVVSLVTAVLLSAATLFSRVFEVSVWEAAVVMMVVGTALIWLLTGAIAHEHEHDHPEDAGEPPEPRVFIAPGEALRPLRRPNRRRR